jgi:hypothetical protein
MRLTIVAPDGTVGVDGEFRKVDLALLDSNIRAVQWDGTIGHIEFYDSSPNEVIDDITKFASIISAWEALTPPPPTPPTEAEIFVAAVEGIRHALQSTIDEKAKTFGFSGGNALMLYAGFTNAFQPLAQTFATWEASVWVEAEAYKAQVIAGTAPMLTPEDAIAMMPAYSV